MESGAAGELASGFSVVAKRRDSTSCSSTCRGLL